MKQPGPAPQYRMQVENISRKNFIPHFAPRKQTSNNINQPKRCISTWQTTVTEVSTLT